MKKSASKKMQVCAGQDVDMLSSFCQETEAGRVDKWKESIGWISEMTGSKE
jgi:hypothetical protein